MLLQLQPQNKGSYFRDEDAPAKIIDPTAVKPEGWLDNAAEYIGDPSAEKPEDW